MTLRPSCERFGLLTATKDYAFLVTELHKLAGINRRAMAYGFQVKLSS